MSFEWRPVRSNVADSLVLKRAFESFDDMRAFLSDWWGAAYNAEIDEIEVEELDFNPASGWNEWAVSGKVSTAIGGHAILGYTSADPRG